MEVVDVPWSVEGNRWEYTPETFLIIMTYKYCFGAFLMFLYNKSVKDLKKKMPCILNILTNKNCIALGRCKYVRSLESNVNLEST